MQRLLAIDVGKKTLGLALYTAEADIVTPLETIKRAAWTADMSILRQVVEDYNVSSIVIGYPLETDGTEGKRCQSVRAFGRMLEAENMVETIAYHDERYSTAAAEDALLAIDASRKTRRAMGDAVAAQFILGSYLDSKIL